MYIKDRFHRFGLADFNQPITIIRKSQDWSYEKEWRIVCNNVKKETFEMKADAVILGFRISEKD